MGSTESDQLTLTALRVPTTSEQQMRLRIASLPAE